MIDSWTWIEYWRGGKHSADAASVIDGEEEAMVSAVNLAETYHWVLHHYDEKTAEEKKAVVEQRCFVVSVDAEIAVESAKLKKAEKLALADSIVLATGRRAGAEVVSGDSDLRGKAGVRYIGPP